MDRDPLTIWMERSVSRDLPHLVLTHDGRASPVAIVGPAIDGKFGVEFLAPADGDDEIAPNIVDEVVREIGFYLGEAGGPDPWAYAIYHCGTGANVYSSVHWSYFEPSG